MTRDRSSKEKRKPEYLTQHQIRRVVESAERVLRDTKTYDQVVLQLKQRAEQLAEDHTLTDKYQLVLEVLTGSLTERDKELLKYELSKAAGG